MASGAGNSSLVDNITAPSLCPGLEPETTGTKHLEDPATLGSIRPLVRVHSLLFCRDGTQPEPHMAKNLSTYFSRPLAAPLF
jgi:hypothetical protein